MKRNLARVVWRVLLWTGIVLYPMVASAQQEVPFRISIFGGFSFLDGERSFVIDDAFFQSEFRNGVTVGARAAADVTDAIAVEAAYGLSTNNLRITERQPRRERTFDLRIHRFDGNILYNFRPVDDPLRPFITAGIGLARFSPSTDAKDLAGLRFIDEPTRISASNKFSFNVGAGAEGRLSDLLSWRGDFRDHITPMPRLGVPETPLSPGGVSFPVSGVVHNIGLTVSLVFRLN
jgi:opacity protein-like surface antigen